jgi:hypothetical protein
MKKFRSYLSISALAVLVAFSSCKNEDEPEAEFDCAAQTYPSTTGSATINIINSNFTTSGDFTVVDANAGDQVAFAVTITKGTNRPQKLRVYGTDCENYLGDIVAFSGQSNTEDDGKRFDLRNTDDPQTIQFVYTVPSGYSTYYLSLETDESGGNYSYKRVRLDISGSGIIDTYAGISLGGNSSSTASRLSSATGLTYLACNAAANINSIDITYAVGTSSPFTSYLCSNPARFQSPISLSSSSASCGEDGTLSTAGGTATYFKLYTGTTTFDQIGDAGLSALTVSSSNNQYIEVTSTSSNNVFEFLNANGKKGLIRVNSGTLNNTTTDINVSVKVQR